MDPDVKVVFQGNVFYLNDKIVKTELGQSIPTYLDKMVEFLCHTKKERESNNGLVVYADDQAINRMLIELQFNEL